MGKKVNEPVTVEEVFKNIESAHFYVVITIQPDGSGEVNTNAPKPQVLELLRKTYIGIES